MLISDWNSDVCPSDLGQEPKYCIVNVSTCIVAKIQDNRFPAGFLFHHIEQETLQFATAHVFHAGIGNPVLAYGINMIAIPFDPLIIKFISQCPGALRSNAGSKFFSVTTESQSHFLVQ